MKYQVQAIKMLTKIGTAEFGDILDKENIIDLESALSLGRVKEVSEEEVEDLSKEADKTTEEIKETAKEADKEANKEVDKQALKDIVKK